MISQPSVLLPPTTNTDVVLYLLDLLAAALDRRDGQEAVNVIHQLRVVAGPTWTDQLIDELIAAGLRRVRARRPQATQPSKETP